MNRLNNFVVENRFRAPAFSTQPPRRKLPLPNSSSVLTLLRGFLMANGFSFKLQVLSWASISSFKWTAKRRRQQQQTHFKNGILVGCLWLLVSGGR